MAAPQFDLFAGAKGFEYARDQNEQDQDNALKSRQNEMMLGDFERRLKEFAEGADLRKQTRENATLQGQMQGVALKGQSAYQQSMTAARASLTPEERADTTVEGGLNKMLRMQLHLARNGATPETIEAFGKELGNAKASALRYSQYDPEMLNRILSGGAFGGAYRVNPVEGKDGVYQVLRRVDQAGVSEDGYPLPPTYQPMAGSEGNLPTVATSMAAMHGDPAGPDAGTNMFDKYQTKDFNQQNIIGATQRAIQAQQLQDNRYAQTDATANRRIDGTADAAQDRNALLAENARLRDAQVNAAQLYKRIKDAQSRMDKLGPNGDVRAKAAIQQEIDALTAQIEVHHTAPAPALAAPAVAPRPDTTPVYTPAPVAAVIPDGVSEAAQRMQDEADDAEADANDALNVYRPGAAKLKAGPTYGFGDKRGLI